MKATQLFKLLLVLLFFSTADVFAQNWNYSIDTVKEISSKENKPIMLVFQGSDWCAPCIKLEKLIWTSPEFVAFANQNLVLLKADFPRKKANRLSDEQTAHNKALAEKYNKEGYYPYILLFNSKGEEITSFGYEKWSPSEYIDFIKSKI